VNQPIVIREFQPGDEEAFRLLNEEWIRRYFRLEPKDLEILGDPHSNILNKGGHILFAVESCRCIACCALLRLGENEYEIAKMAVTDTHQRGGIGRQLLQATCETARALGARRLWLETNRALAPAIRLYESLGFQHVPPERATASPYVRSDVQMEKFFD